MYGIGAGTGTIQYYPALLQIGNQLSIFFISKNRMIYSIMKTERLFDYNYCILENWQNLY